MAYSTQKISSKLVDELKTILQNVTYGSIEIYVQDRKVTQITVRHIKKTSFSISTDFGEKRNGEDRHFQNAKVKKIEVLTIKK